MSGSKGRSGIKLSSRRQQLEERRRSQTIELL